MPSVQIRLSVASLVGNVAGVCASRRGAAGCRRQARGPARPARDGDEGQARIHGGERQVHGDGNATARGGLRTGDRGELCVWPIPPLSNPTAWRPRLRVRVCLRGLRARQQRPRQCLHVTRPGRSDRTGEPHAGWRQHALSGSHAGRSPVPLLTQRAADSSVSIQMAEWRDSAWIRHARSPPSATSS